MASNKECLIIILDVRRGADEDFKLKSVKVAAEILKEKICSGKTDLVSFVLVGCKRTSNKLDSNEQHNEYQHIVEYPETQMATWQLLVNFFKFVNEESNEDGDWLDALAVATDKIKVSQSIFKCARQRILLCYDFNNTKQNYTNYEVITENILTSEIELIVATHNIFYTDNPETNETQAVFGSPRRGNDHEVGNQKYAQMLVSSCNANLCNFKEVLSSIFTVRNRRPWSWNAKLNIGRSIFISISGIIAMKDESHIKIKKCYGESDEVVSRETKHFVHGTEVFPLPEELIEGYMLGGTPVPFDACLMEYRNPFPPGLKFIGFVDIKAVPDEYYCGDALYLIVHQKNNEVSARKLDALVRAMCKTERCMLCWKVFSMKFNKPKLVVLHPNPIKEDSPATLTMIELSYHSQHHFWDFPALRTAKTECTLKQMRSVDELIDSMDLQFSLNDTHLPRETRLIDLVPFNKLPHIFEQNVMDLLERKILCAEQDTEQFQEMLADKNFVDIYWKLHECVEIPAKIAANKIGKLFPLKESSAYIEKLRSKYETPPPTLIKPEPKDSVQAKENRDAETGIKCVGLDTPMEDFEVLLENRVLNLTNSTERDAEFQVYAEQMRNIIEQLLNKEPTGSPALEKLADALMAYRKRSIEFNDFANFNKWLESLKALVLSRNSREFWSEVVVKHQLGLITVGEPTVEDKSREAAFFVVQEWPTTQELN